MNNNEKMASLDELDQRIWAILDEQDKVLSELEALLSEPLQSITESNSATQKSIVPESDQDPKPLTQCLPRLPDHKDIQNTSPIPKCEVPKLQKDRIQPISWELGTKKSLGPQTEKVRPNHRGRGK